MERKVRSLPHYRESKEGSISGGPCGKEAVNTQSYHMEMAKTDLHLLDHNTENLFLVVSKNQAEVHVSCS